MKTSPTSWFYSLCRRGNIGVPVRAFTLVLCVLSLLVSPSEAGKKKKPGAGNAVKVRLTVSNATQELTKTAQLTAVITPSSANATNYKFEIKRKTSANWYTLGTGASRSFTWVRRVAGQFHLRVTATVNGRPVRSPNVYAVTQFPSYSSIVGDADVSSRTNTAWSNTKNATTATSRREEGFWIRLNTAGNGKYEFTATVLGPSVGPATGASVEIGARPADNPQQPAPNANGVVYSVASFHTHTPTTYRSVGRDVGPSGPDQNMDSNVDRVPGVVYDYIATIGNGIPAGHPLHSAAQRYHSGLTRRPTVEP
jgi:hypothetical protein